MSQHSTLRSLCVSRITPVIAALTFTLAAPDASASTAGQTAIQLKLTQTTGKADILKAKAADLLYAVALVLEDNTATDGDGDFSGLTAAEIVESALESIGGKARADKDKIAGQLVSQAIASRNLALDAAAASAVVTEAFTVNAGTKLALKTTGQAAVVAAAVQSVDPVIADEVGAALATQAIPDVSGLLVNTAKALGKNTIFATEGLASFVSGLVPKDGQGDSIVSTAAAKVAASNPAAAGAFYGGLVDGNGNFDSTGEIQALAQALTGNLKLAKAFGEILANIAGIHGDKDALATSLIAGQKAPNAALIVQGILRAGTEADVNAVLGTVLGAATGKNRETLAKTVAVGSGGDEDKLTEIVETLLSGLAVGTDKAKVNTAVINAIATLNPEGAAAATAATLASGGIDAATLATTTVAKIKSTSAAGYMAGEAVETILNGSTNTGTAAGQAVAIMAKGTKAATDIALRVAQIPGIDTQSVAFAEAIADANKKFVLNAAVGVSLADIPNTADITLRAITHDFTISGTKVTGDTAALAQAPKIAGAVATAVDMEQATLIANALGGATSEKGTTANKPLKLTQIPTLTTALAKAIQTKPNETTVNRMDELGELAAILTHHVINLFTNDTKGQTARAKMIATIGSNVIKSLSKKQLDARRTLAADITTAEDIAGSIAQTIFDFAGLDAGVRDALLSATGSLITSLKKAAKTEATAIDTAFSLVRSGGSGTRYETGTPGAGFTDIREQLNDPETDNRDAS